MSTSPELVRTDLTTPILQLKSLGIDDLMKFDWVTAPPAQSILRALEGLLAAGMVGDDGRLSVIGGKVAECPIEVNLARMVSFNQSPKSDSSERIHVVAVQLEGLSLWRGGAFDSVHDYNPSKHSPLSMIHVDLHQLAGRVHYP